MTNRIPRPTEAEVSTIQLRQRHGKTRLPTARTRATEVDDKAVDSGNRVGLASLSEGN